MPKLNQVIAIEKTVKARVKEELDALYKLIQKATLFDGFHKTYTVTREGEEQAAPETKRVQQTASTVLARLRERYGELFSVVAQKDAANLEATGDVSTSDGAVLATSVPTTTLLFMEKQLAELHTFVSKLPTLDPAEDWRLDAVRGMWVTEPTRVVRTKKVQRPIVLYDATKEHPAQTQLVSEDIPVGAWEQVKVSGAMPEPERARLLGRIDEALRAVKFAREQANTTNAPPVAVGEVVLNWIFAR